MPKSTVFFFGEKKSQRKIGAKIDRFSGGGGGSDLKLAFTEVLAQNLPCFGGVQLAVDITLRSSLTCNGEAHLHAAEHDGAVLAQARQDKERVYPELASSGQCKLVVVAIDTGGRWSDEAGSDNADVGTLQGARGTVLHAVSCDPDVGTQVDEDVGRRLCHFFCRVRWWSQRGPFRCVGRMGRRHSWLLFLSVIPGSRLHRGTCLID